MARATRKVLDLALVSCKAIRPVIATTWEYSKVEVVPPGTTEFFRGPFGQKIESTCAGIADGIINGLKGQIKSIDQEQARRAQEKIDAIKAALKKEAEEARKKEEEKKKAAAEKAEADKKAAAAKELERKAKEEKDKKEKDAKQAKAGGRSAKKKGSKRSPAKKNRRQPKKESAPKK